MGFAAGSVSFRRFAVVGEQPDQIDQELLDKLSEHALRPGDVGVSDEMEYGWSGGRHVLDGDFSFENNVYADALHFALRIDTNKVPSELKKAYAIMEEEAVASTNPSGFISKNQKRDVKDVVNRKLEDELRTGKFRRSKLLPILWDLPAHTIYCAASAKSIEQLMELTLSPLSAGSLAMQLLEPKGKRRDYEDLRPTRFIPGPESEGQWPEYPWVLKGPEPKDFLGNEFLLWLWHEAEAKDGAIKTDAGEVTILFEKSLDLDCAYGQSGKDALRAAGPTHMPEARDALRTGKLPRKAGLICEANGVQFSFAFNPEAFATNALKLPDIEDAASSRVVFEERIALIREFCKVTQAMFDAFLHLRGGSGWEGQVAKMRRWILQTNKPVTVTVNKGVVSKLEHGKTPVST